MASVETDYRIQGAIVAIGTIAIATLLGMACYSAGKNYTFVNLETYGCEKVLQLHKDGKL